MGRAKQFGSRQAQDFILARNYFFNEYAHYGDRTRPSIRLNIISTLNDLLRGDVGQMFSQRVEITPDLTFDGKIIIINLPVSEWGKLGRVAQGLYKFIFEKAVERRQPEATNLPVFLWADEAQYFINQFDQLFLTTARSARCMTVFLTQNIENYYLAMGQHATRSLLGNLQTKIFHQNLDTATNHYASELVGKQTLERGGRSISMNTDGKSPNLSYSSNEYDTQVLPPEVFNQLRNGSQENNFEVDSIVIQGGRFWGEQLQPFTLVSFNQKFLD